ncbi:MAG: N-acetylmuramoyl-L-alanine amidase [Sphaerochaetaceae bacterium]
MKRFLIVFALVLLAILPSAAAEGPFNHAVGLVVIDPGHGGHDPGAVGNGLNEKDAVLSIALKLRDLLSDDGIEVVMTRDSDVFVELEQRCVIANSALWPEGKSALFVSIHANSSEASEASGFEVYTARNDKVIDFLNESTPAGIGFRFASLSREKASQECALMSDRLGRAIVDSIASGFPYMNRRGLKEGNLYVLNCTAMPSALVEAAFISNPEEVLSLGSDAFAVKMAEAIESGILDYSDSIR